MSKSKLSKNSLEILEARIAPAALLPTNENSFVKATLGAPVEVKAGQVLSTTGGSDGGYILYVEKGNALVFFSDLNNNRQIDYNELTGISAGDGLRMTSFVNIHGDIVTNLRETTATFAGPGGVPIVKTLLTLSDSDNNPSNDSLSTKGDGRVLLNKTIEKVELRSLNEFDIEDQDGDGDVDDDDIAQRKLPTTYSIFGNIYAGRGFGAEDGGLIIDTTGGINYGFEFHPTVGSIKTGTAVSGEYYNFGVSASDDSAGNIIRFTPPRGQAGGDIIGVKAAAEDMTYQIDEIVAGDGGFGARGGNVQNVILNGDDTNGYIIAAGNGGGGLNGGDGGSILAFSDLGSSTGRVIISSGSGGTGATGSGGAGGQFLFENFTVRGNTTLELGDGGDGFTAGGAGASLTKGDFGQTDGTEFLRGNGYGTTHLPSSALWQEEINYTPILGTHEAVDFDGDGFGDFVYTTRTTSTVVVLFGNGNGGFRSTTTADGLIIPDRMYLSGVRNAESLTIGDMNGDGHVDIAVASIDEGARSGVSVFLAQYEHEGPGELTGSEDLNKNGQNDFLGFRTPRYSQLPNYSLGVPTQVSSLATGDFNGDGVPDIAVISTAYGQFQSDDNGVVTGLSRPSQVLNFLIGDVEFDNLTGSSYLSGQFYVDTLSDFFAALVVSPENRGAESMVMEATALSTTATNDVVLVGLRGDNEVQAISYVGNIPTFVGVFNLGQVDTNRRTGADNVTLTDFTMRDFTALDYDGDGNVDVAAISQGLTFLVASKGNGTGGGTFDSNLTPPTAGAPGDQAGNFFNQQVGYENLHAIKSFDGDADGDIDDVGVYLTRDGRARVEVFNVVSGSDTITSLGVFAVQNGAGNDNVLYDVHYNLTADLLAPAIAIATPNPGDPPGNVILFGGLSPDSTGTSVGLSRIAFELSAGNGGDSSIGNGGKGGSLGGGATIVDSFDPITGLTTKDLVGSVNFELVGRFAALAGDGGNGFANGGAGGDATGIVLRYRDSANQDLGNGAIVQAGAGGRGVSGTGGAGGDIKDSSFETDSGGGTTGPNANIDPVTLFAGNGGAGLRGGAGGSVLGNQTVVPDAFVSSYRVTAGAGGAGIKQGGAGGDIRNLAPLLQVNSPFSELGIGLVIYEAGAGGSAVSGRGGDGGSIANSSPRPNAFASSTISLNAGDAGSGLTGGTGGSVSDFTLQLIAESRLPLAFNATGGHGGSGFAGGGGDGGSVTDLRVPSRALADTSRILAGNGGSSAAKAGGTGGSIANIIGSATQGAYALVSGAGGVGLTAGGRGGNVTNADISVGAETFAKVLVIAGAGGDATAYVTPAGDVRSPFAFGGRAGEGGDGGSIIGFSQKGSNASHVDLIGGNGGSTLNYGDVTDSKSFVGRGGSVENINVASDIGNVSVDLVTTTEIDENVPIKSYNNIFAGETIVDFVETKLRLAGAAPITDADGNVGVVVGVAGRIKAVQLADGSFQTQPASDAVNGSLINVSARNLMSAVAGSVDRIASIQLTKGLKIANGIIGADKGSFIVPGIDPTPPDETGDNKGSGTVASPDYLLTDANTLVPFGGPVLDGALVDGALVTKKLVDDQGRPVNLPGRVFLL